MPNEPTIVTPPGAPVTLIDPDEAAAGPETGVALCLSGGGYRAMLFHLGGLVRLNEAAILKSLNRVSSVSGGSITAAMLGLRWKNLTFDGNGVATNLNTEVVDPIRALGARTVDIGSVLGGALMPGTIGDKVAQAYDKYLFKGAILQDLPSDTEGPRFVINATNVQSGALWRFSKPYMADYRVGKILNPRISLAVAVGASSAFPPFLSPVELELDPASYEPNSGTDLQSDSFTASVVLSDGGVYDNLGLETAWKRYSTVLVSDGGGKMCAQAEPKRDWPRHVLRVLDLIDNQVRSLRKRQLIDSFTTAPGPMKREGAYWGIRSHVKDYELADTLPCDEKRAEELAKTPTRLKRLEPAYQERLINWGYAICDTALRKHYNKNNLTKGQFPYPNVGV